MPLFQLATGAGSGTVTSVGLTAPSSILSVTGSPVTTAGVLALALVTQAANLVWAGPTTGASANPTFRALVAADFPAPVSTLAALSNATGFLKNDGSGVLSWASVSASAAGSSTYIQYNTGGAFDASSSLTWNDSTKVLAVGGLVSILQASAGGVRISNSSTNPPYILFGIGATNYALEGVANQAGDINNNSHAGDYCFRTIQSGNIFRFSADNGTNDALTVATTGIFVSGSCEASGSHIAYGYTSTSLTAVNYGVSGGNGYFQSLAAGSPNSLSIDATPLIFRGASYAEYFRGTAALFKIETALQVTSLGAGYVVSDASGNVSIGSTPGTGSVTSVGLTVPAFLSVAGSPVTTAGTLAVTLATQSANTVFAGPTTGSAAAPTFRALVAADFSSIPATTFTMATARILGRTTAGTGVVEELTAGTSLSLSSGSLNAIQDIRTTATPTFVGVNGSSSLLLKTGGTMAVTIDSAQHVGIGSAPNTLFLLDVVGSIGATSARVVNSTGNGIELQTDTAPYISAQNRGTASYLVLNYQGLSHAWYVSTTLAATLDSSGNFGIGVSPTFKFDVAGAGRFAVGAGGTLLTLDASTGTANTGGSIAFGRGGTNKWSLGTGISIGADAFELYDRANLISAFSVAASTSAAIFAGPLTVIGNPGSAYKFAVKTATNINFGVYASSGTTTTVAAVNDANSAFVPFKIEALSQVFSTNGAVVMTINSSGVVGIGAAPSTSTNEPLQISRGGSYTGIDIINTAAAGRSWLVISNASLGGLPAGGFVIWDGTAGAARMSINTSGDTTFAGSITTANPSGGTAQPVKFGSYVGGAPAATGYQQIEINGTAYKLLCST